MPEEEGFDFFNESQDASKVKLSDIFSGNLRKLLYVSTTSATTGCMKSHWRLFPKISRRKPFAFQGKAPVRPKTVGACTDTKT